MRNTETLQRQFDTIAKDGAFMNVYETTTYFAYGIVDSFTIVRETTEAVWVILKAGGYNNNMQYVSLLKIVRTGLTPDQGLLYMVDDRGRRYELYPLKDDELAQWKAWLAYKLANADDFKRADEEILHLNTQFAEEWPQ